MIDSFDSIVLSSITELKSNHDWKLEQKKQNNNNKNNKIITFIAFSGSNFQ